MKSKEQTFTIKMSPASAVVALLYGGNREKAEELIKKYHLSLKEFGLESN